MKRNITIILDMDSDDALKYLQNYYSQKNYMKYDLCKTVRLALIEAALNSGWERIKEPI
jgi:hypothetical protein